MRYTGEITHPPVAGSHPTAGNFFFPGRATGNSLQTMGFIYVNDTLVNNAFTGKQRLMLFFNRSINEDLILAIQSAGVSNGRNGFRKDKSGEKLAESEEDLLEHRTDGTDAFDTLYIGCEKFPFPDTFSLSMSGVPLRLSINFSAAIPAIPE